MLPDEALFAAMLTCMFDNLCGSLGSICAVVLHLLPCIHIKIIKGLILSC